MTYGNISKVEVVFDRLTTEVGVVAIAIVIAVFTALPFMG